MSDEIPNGDQEPVEVRDNEAGKTTLDVPPETEEVEKPVGRPKGVRDSKRRKRAPNQRSLVLLPEEKLQEMFTVYCQMPNYSYVGRVCRVNMSTVRKYAKLQNWEERKQKILEEARKNTDYTLVKASEQSLLMLRALKNKIAQKIQNLNAQSLNTDSIVPDFERLVKLEQMLLGGVTDRTEHQLSTHEERIRKLREERMLALPRPH